MLNIAYFFLYSVARIISLSPLDIVVYTMVFFERIYHRKYHRNIEERQE